jgi:hypothetical protein
LFRENQMNNPWTLPRVLTALLVLTTIASAQQAPTVRIRGTIEAVDGPLLSIKTREGNDVEVRTTDNLAVFGIVKTWKSGRAPISASPLCRSRMAHKMRLRFTSSRKATVARPKDFGPGISAPTRP